MGRRAARTVLCWSLALGVLGLGLAWIRASEFGALVFDRGGLVLADSLRKPWLDVAFLRLTWLGSLLVLLPAALAGGVLLWRQGLHREAHFLVAALAGAALVAHLAKHLAQRPRPDMFPALTSVASPLSYPSAHAAQIAALAVASWLILPRLAPRRWPWAAPALVSVVLLVGFSRLYLQVHFPSDVLAGYLAAGFWVAGLHALMLENSASNP